MMENKFLSATRFRVELIRRINRNPIRLISRAQILDTERNLFLLMIRRRAWSSFDVIVFNQWPRSLWVRVFVSPTLRRILKWHLVTTQMILNISSRESSHSENRTIFAIITVLTLVCMNTDFVWDGNVHKMKTHSWMCSIEIRHTAFGATGEISISEKHGDVTKWKHFPRYTLFVRGIHISSDGYVFGLIYLPNQGISYHNIDLVKP